MFHSDVVDNFNSEYLSNSCVICDKPLTKKKVFTTARAVMTRVTCGKQCLKEFRTRRDNSLGA